MYLILLFFIIFFIYIFSNIKNKSPENKINSIYNKNFIEKYTISKRNELESLLDKGWNKEQKKYIFTIFENTCFNCGSKSNLQIDHNIPLSKGYGLKNNAVLLCNKCNSLKKDLLPWDFYPPDKLSILENKYKLISRTSYNPDKITLVKKNLKSYKISLINNAISSGKKISFHYFESDNKKRLTNHLFITATPVTVYRGMNFSLYASNKKYFLDAIISDNQKRDFVINKMFCIKIEGE